MFLYEDLVVLIGLSLVLVVELRTGSHGFALDGRKI